MLRTTLGGLLLAVSMGALADGVPLITAGPTIQPSPALQRLTTQPGVVKVHPITFNKGAFGANVLTVVVNGKERRFGGQLVTKPAPASGQPVIDTWVGKEGSGSLTDGVLTVSRHSKGDISGVMQLDGHTFEIKSPVGVGSWVMVEIDPAATPRIQPYVPETPASGGSK